MPVIPGTRSRQRPIRYDRMRLRDRWRAEVVFCRLKEFRGVATRYDILASNYASAVADAALVMFWRRLSSDHKHFALWSSWRRANQVGQSVSSVPKLPLQICLMDVRDAKDHTTQ